MQANRVVGPVPPAAYPPLVEREVRQLPTPKRFCEPSSAEAILRAPRSPSHGGMAGSPKTRRARVSPQPSSVTIIVTFFVTVSPQTPHTLCNPMQPSRCSNSLRNRRNRAAGGRILDLQVLVELVLKTRVRATGPWVRIPPPPPFDSRGNARSSVPPASRMASRPSVAPERVVGQLLHSHT